MAYAVHADTAAGTKDKNKTQNTASLVNATNTIKDVVPGVGGVTMDDVVAAGKNAQTEALKAKYAETLNQVANSGNGQGNGSVLGETGTAHIEANPQGGGGGGGGRSAGAAAKPTYTAATLPSATSQESYINALYDANAQKQKAALEAQYTANVGALDQQAAKIPGQYDAAANQAAAQAAINRANFNEQAAATGLNTGATGQAALAQNNALLGAVSEIRKNQADALNDVESQRTALQQQYQKAIAEAIANNEADRAAALYNEAKRVDESLVSTAVNQATENYRAWQAMYK
jgi:hypothetical protein